MPSSKLFIIVYIIMSLSLWACHKTTDDNQAPFETKPISVPVVNKLQEASGMASSKMNPGYLWVHEDGGNPAQILLLKNGGSFSKVMVIDGSDNIDWEDMSLSTGPDPSLNYLYIADVGDNLLARTEYALYRFAEPSLDTDTVRAFAKIRFEYPDGPHDAEAILVEPSTKNIYIITKSDNPSRVYKLAYPQSITSLNQAILSGKLTFGGVTGAAMSPDGKEIIIKTYPALHYFVLPAGNTVEKLLQKTPRNLAYQVEPKGEALTFAADNSGFYTLSERAFSPSVNLFFYKRR